MYIFDYEIGAKQMMNNIKVIVFDLYNTLIALRDSNHFFLKLYKKSHNGFEMLLPDYLRRVMQHDIQELFRILPSDFEHLYKQNQDELSKALASIIVYDDVINVLEDLRNKYSLFLISNLASPYKEPFFSNKLDTYFTETIFSCDCGCVKPQNEIFKKVEILAGTKPSKILMVGDSFKSDIKGAKDMGWNYLRINRNSIPKKDFEIKSLKVIKQRLS